MNNQVYQKSCITLIAQEGHRLSKLMVINRDKENAFTILQLIREDNTPHPKAGHFLEHFYQQQEVVSQCSWQTFLRDTKITRLVLS